MRCALLSDAHANLPALEAVLADIAARPGIEASGLPSAFADQLRAGGSGAPPRGTGLPTPAFRNA